MKKHESSEESNNKDIKKLKNTDNQLPVSIFDLINRVQANVIDIRDNPDFQIKSSWLIINIDWKWCKGYCMWENEIPNVCWKWEQCLNFWRATKILKKINDFKNEQSLKNMY